MNQLTLINSVCYIELGAPGNHPRSADQLEVIERHKDSAELRPPRHRERCLVDHLPPRLVHSARNLPHPTLWLVVAGQAAVDEQPLTSGRVERFAERPRSHPAEPSPVRAADAGPARIVFSCILQGRQGDAAHDGIIDALKFYGGIGIGIGKVKDGPQIGIGFGQGHRAGGQPQMPVPVRAPRRHTGR